MAARRGKTTAGSPANRSRALQRGSYLIITDDGMGLLRENSKVTRVSRPWTTPVAYLTPDSPLRECFDAAGTHRWIRVSTTSECRPTQSLYPCADRTVQDALNLVACYDEHYPQAASSETPESLANLVEYVVRAAESVAGIKDTVLGSKAVSAWLKRASTDRAQGQTFDEWLTRAYRHHSAATEPAEEDQPGNQDLEVALESPTGSVTYTLPFGLDETYGPTEVGEILSPTGKPNRTAAKVRRDKSELLGVEIGNAYRYPKFQLDAPKHRVHPVVAYANSELSSSEDPWGVLDWWYTVDETISDRRPVDLVESGELTKDLVARTIERDRRGMS